jgi:S1-C subfamily serine protease
MDEQQTPFPHQAPTPPTPTPQQAPTPPPADPHVAQQPLEPASAHRGGVRRLLAAATAAAVVAGFGGIGAGYAIGHGGLGSSNQTTSSNNVASVDGGSTSTIPGPGFDGGTWSDGGAGGATVPSLPFDGAYGGQSTVPQGQSPDSTETTSEATSTQIKGLVRIVSTLTYEGGEAAGTGMVLTSDGEVVTNHHVVAGATSVKVKVMSSGKTYQAKVVGTDAADDVAVLQLVGASGLSTITADTDGISVGSKVTAVGDANGTVDTLSAAPGRVLALRQSITTQSEGAAAGERLTGLMEISSDVISGDSGGATYDADGQVVGMTTAASSGGSDVTGYAVPISKVLRIVGDLDSGVTSSRYDYTRPAFLGIGLDGTGTTVLGVYDGTPAASAGIDEGDQITAIGSTRVQTSTQLRRAVAAHSPGDSIRVTWTDTSGASHTATLTLAAGAVE